LLATLAGRIYDHAPQQNANPLGVGTPIKSITVKEIPGAEGDLYEPASRSHHLALEQLKPVLESLGFRVRTKPQKEKTLRVYVGSIGIPPLLNPRFQRSTAGKGRSTQREVLAITVLSKGDRMLSARLEALPRTQSLDFRRVEEFEQDYYVHGTFQIPLAFTPDGHIDFSAITPALREVRIVIEGPLLWVGNHDA
jgi:hypothetical protein